jgi:ketosteroid isomerase-like protein
MYSQGTIEALNKVRLAGLQEASEKRDVDALMSWHSEDAVFTDVGTDV